MACYTDYHECFKEDDCGKIQELLQEDGLLPEILTSAASYSMKRQISANMTRVLVWECVSSAGMYHAVWMLDEMISGKHSVEISDVVLRLLQEEMITQQGMEIEDGEVHHEQLIQHIGTCPEPEFDQFLDLIGQTGISLNLPDDIILVTLERAKRRLKDDRAFFLTLYAAFLTSAFEQLLVDYETYQTTILEQLEEMGYEVEAVPGATDTFTIYSPDITDTFTDYFPPEPSGYNPASGIEWAARQTRRKHGRRRGR